MIRSDLFCKGRCFRSSWNGFPYTLGAEASMLSHVLFFRNHGLPSTGNLNRAFMHSLYLYPYPYLYLKNAPSVTVGAPALVKKSAIKISFVPYHPDSAPLLNPLLLTPYS